ncbi:hypothetical protein L1987_20056 [Smallanthus sonchifolius]|uniref:Uncharacterized protein n=1 Tax=Smallanthus sonchifolius TaxID=185202 RepID=A0ACB9IQA5_9ASTR|nr:hypothetical protein L1987_20056 [Smallanthus sonchifolius]
MRLLSTCISSGKVLFLFNPSIRILKLIPSSSLEDRLEKSVNRVGRDIGFVYDEITDDYKGIRLYNIYEHRVMDSVVDVKHKAEVYSSRNDESHMSIITFNFSAVFREIQPPQDSEPELTYVLTYNGSLAILVLWGIEEYQRAVDEEAVEVEDESKEDGSEEEVEDLESGQVVNLDEFDDHECIIVKDYVESLL